MNYNIRDEILGIGCQTLRKPESEAIVFKIRNAA